MVEEEVRVTLPPWQKVVEEPAVIVGVIGVELTVITTAADELETQLLLLLQQAFAWAVI